MYIYILSRITIVKSDTQRKRWRSSESNRIETRDKGNYPNHTHAQNKVVRVYAIRIRIVYLLLLIFSHIVFFISFFSTFILFFISFVAFSLFHIEQKSHECRTKRKTFEFLIQSYRIYNLCSS